MRQNKDYLSFNRQSRTHHSICVNLVMKTLNAILKTLRNTVAFQNSEPVKKLKRMSEATAKICEDTREKVYLCPWSDKPLKINCQKLVMPCRFDDIKCVIFLLISNLAHWQHKTYTLKLFRRIFEILITVKSNTHSLFICY